MLGNLSVASEYSVFKKWTDPWKKLLYKIGYINSLLSVDSSLCTAS